jgi:DNA-binding MarR family transcriptional regulator
MSVRTTSAQAHLQNQQSNYYQDQQPRILEVLSHDKPLNRREIAEQLNSASHCVTASIKHLINDGYIKELPKELDVVTQRLAIKLTITKKGLFVLQQWQNILESKSDVFKAVQEMAQKLYEEEKYKKQTQESSTKKWRK